MPTQEKPLRECLTEIEELLDWGPATNWTNQDFEALSDRITTATGVNLSVTTLKRVWGRVAYASQPSTTTLDALARFAGHEGWRDYRKEKSDPEVVAAAESPSRSASPYLIVLLVGIVITLALLLNGTSIAPASAPDATLDASDFAFDLRPVTSGVPNSVIFTYNASAAKTGEIYLQQSWDDRRRERLRREGTTHTSIYYLPGFYQAKLIVDDRVVQERELLIKSDGWVVAVEADPVPLYLATDEVLKGGQLTVSEANLERFGINMQPSPPTVIVTNVGMLNGLYSDDFYFRTRLRSDYAAGAAICQQVRIMLLLKNSVIIVPLSAPGCVAELEMMAGGRNISGRDTDLSAFGVMGDRWVEIACRGNDRLVTFNIDGREVYRMQSQEEALEVVGIRYVLNGPGSIDEVAFANGAGEVYRETF